MGNTKRINMRKMMNRALSFGAVAALCALATLRARGADGMTRYNATSGSKMRVEGTSTLHDWRVVSSLITGHLEVGPSFPKEPGQSVQPGKVDAHGEAVVNNRSLRSINKDGSYYEDKMDDKMYEMLKSDTNPKIVFTIKGLTLKEAAKDKDSPYVFDATGDLEVAGVTNNIAFPASIFIMPDKKIKVTGSVPLKMTQFKIPPESILFVKTADDVTVKFEWMLKPGTAPAAAAASK
jgi:hypothetical protein